MIRDAEKLSARVKTLMLEGRRDDVRDLLLNDVNRPILVSMLGIVLASKDTLAAGFKGIARSLYDLRYPSDQFCYQNCIDVDVKLAKVPVAEVMYEILGMSIRDQLAVVALMSMCDKRRAELEAHLVAAAESGGKDWEAIYVLRN